MSSTPDVMTNVVNLPPQPPTEQQIRMRAYHLWEKRKSIPGAEHVTAKDDWRSAQEELWIEYQEALKAAGLEVPSTEHAEQKNVAD